MARQRDGSGPRGAYRAAPADIDTDRSTQPASGGIRHAVDDDVAARRCQVAHYGNAVVIARRVIASCKPDPRADNSAAAAQSDVASAAGDQCPRAYRNRPTTRRIGIRIQHHVATVRCERGGSAQSNVATGFQGQRAVAGDVAAGVDAACIGRQRHRTIYRPGAGSEITTGLGDGKTRKGAGDAAAGTRQAAGDGQGAAAGNAAATLGELGNAGRCGNVERAAGHQVDESGSGHVAQRHGAAINSEALGAGVVVGTAQGAAAAQRQGTAADIEGAQIVKGQAVEDAATGISVAVECSARLVHKLGTGSAGEASGKVVGGREGAIERRAGGGALPELGVGVEIQCAVVVEDGAVVQGYAEVATGKGRRSLVVHGAGAAGRAGVDGQTGVDGDCARGGEVAGPVHGVGGDSARTPQIATVDIDGRQVQRNARIDCRTVNAENAADRGGDGGPGVEIAGTSAETQRRTIGDGVAAGIGSATAQVERAARHRDGAGVVECEVGVAQSLDGGAASLLGDAALIDKVVPRVVPGADRRGIAAAQVDDTRAGIRPGQVCCVEEFKRAGTADSHRAIVAPVAANSTESASNVGRAVCGECARADEIAAVAPGQPVEGEVTGTTDGVGVAGAVDDGVGKAHGHVEAGIAAADDDGAGAGDPEAGIDRVVASEEFDGPQAGDIRPGVQVGGSRTEI